MNALGFSAWVSAFTFVELSWRANGACRLGALFIEQRDWQGALVVLREGNCLERRVFVDGVPARLFAEGRGLELEPPIDLHPGTGPIILRVTNDAPSRRELRGAWLGKNLGTFTLQSVVGGGA